MASPEITNHHVRGAQNFLSGWIDLAHQHKDKQGFEPKSNEDLRELLIKFEEHHENSFDNYKKIRERFSDKAYIQDMSVELQASALIHRRMLYGSYWVYDIYGKSVGLPPPSPAVLIGNMSLSLANLPDTNRLDYEDYRLKSKRDLLEDRGQSPYAKRFEKFVALAVAERVSMTDKNNIIIDPTQSGQHVWTRTQPNDFANKEAILHG